MTANRREFVRAGVGAVAAGTAGKLIAAAAEEHVSAEPAALPIVDTHQHLWNLDNFQLSWLKPGEPLRRNFLMDDYRRAVEGLGVAKAVYMEVDVEENQQVAEAEHVIAVCKRPDNPTVAAVISGRPATDGFKAYITRFAKSPFIKGVRRLLFKPEPGLERPFVQGVRLLGGLGLSFDLCLPPTALDVGAKLAARCPDTRFILDHCGNADPKAFSHNESTEAKAEHRADPWRRDLAKVARQPNVVCKISGIVARAEKGRWKADDLAPIINHCLDEFGPDRVVFGSDWPVCTRAATLKQCVAALREVVAGRPEGERKKLWHDNAVEFYGLGGSG